MGHSTCCEYCPQQINCRNLYVAMKILEEELRFAQRDDLYLEFGKLRHDVIEAGFAYPESDEFCSIARSSTEARHLVERAYALLQELRRTVSLCPA